MTYILVDDGIESYTALGQTTQKSGLRLPMMVEIVSKSQFITYLRPLKVDIHRIAVPTDGFHTNSMIVQQSKEFHQLFDLCSLSLTY